MPASLLFGPPLKFRQLIEWPRATQIVCDLSLSLAQTLSDLPSPPEQEIQHSPGKEAGTQTVVGRCPFWKAKLCSKEVKRNGKQMCHPQKPEYQR